MNAIKACLRETNYCLLVNMSLKVTTLTYDFIVECEDIFPHQIGGWLPGLAGPGLVWPGLAWSGQVCPLPGYLPVAGSRHPLVSA